MIEAPLRSRAAEAVTERPTARASSSSLAVLPVRLFLGLGWMRSGVEKVISSEWWAGDEVRVFLVEMRPRALPPALPLVDGLASAALPIAAIVVVLQIAVAVALLAGRYVRPALWTGIGMNVSFMMLGSVNPSAFYLVMQLAVLLGLALDGDALKSGVLRDATGRAAMRTGLAAAAAVLALLPFITTLHPAGVIEDPAVVLSTIALLAAGSQYLRWSLLTAGRPLEQPWSRRLETYSRHHRWDSWTPKRQSR